MRGVAGYLVEWNVILDMVRESTQAVLSDCFPSDEVSGESSSDARSGERSDGSGFPLEPPEDRADTVQDDGEGEGGDAPHPGTIVYSPPERHIPDDVAPTESIDRPTPDPRAEHPVDREELEKAAFGLVMATESDENPKAAALLELPRWIDSDDIPDYQGQYTETGRSDECLYCGTRHPWDRPLERGRSIERMGDDGNPWLDACPPGKYNIESCQCCVCCECGSKSIYARAAKSPTYRCRNPNCQAEFEHPVSPVAEDLDADTASAIDGSGGVRTRLYWECQACHRPVLAPFDGVPDEWFDGFSPPR